LAIAAGAASRALLIARDYAELRRQGGSLIKEHDAVAQLLGKARQILGLTESAMTSLTTGPLNRALLIEVWRKRALLHPMLCTVASNAMQVLGGIGYMRDQGVEKLLRDCNQLRLLGGSPSELTLCSAAWESSL
jgi:alkylation response protein AidB-like acyl-CoA dehydrogenase